MRQASSQAARVCVHRRLHPTEQINRPASTPAERATTAAELDRPRPSRCRMGYALSHARARMRQSCLLVV